MALSSRPVAVSVNWDNENKKSERIKNGTKYEAKPNRKRKRKRKMEMKKRKEKVSSQKKTNMVPYCTRCRFQNCFLSPLHCRIAGSLHFGCCWRFVTHEKEQKYCDGTVAYLIAVANAGNANLPERVCATLPLFFWRETSCRIITSICRHVK